MRFIKQVKYSGVGIYSEYFIGLIISIIVARSLKTEDYGIYATLVWNAALINILILSGLQDVTTKFTAEFSEKNKNLSNALWILRKIYILRILIIGLPVSISVFFMHQSSNIHFMVLSFIVLTALIKSNYIFKVSILKGLKRFDTIALNNILVNPINLLIVITCYFIYPNLTGFITAFCISSMLYNVCLYFYRSQIPRPSFNEEFEKSHKKRILTQMYSASFVSIIGALVFKQSQVSFLNFSGFFEAAGYFNIGFVLATAALTLIPGVFNEVLLPRIIQSSEEKSRHLKTQEAEKYLFILGCFVALPTIIYADFIIVTLFGTEYEQASIALKSLVAIKLLSLLKEGSYLSIVAADEQQQLIIFSIFLITITFILSYLLVPIYALQAALAVYGLMSFIQFIFYRKIAYAKGYKLLPWKKIFQILFCGFVSIIPAVIFFNQSNLISFILGNIIFAFLYIFINYKVKNIEKSLIKNIFRS